ncbi:MAG: FecR family protein [Treponema sp.]|jgi:hypothetical protein|nr:FecR family protein [Treponema sp.]
MKKFVLFIAAVSLGLGAFAQSGRITELAGTVELKPAGAAASGDPVERSTIVSMGFKSSVVIEVGSATILVRPLTRLSLEEIAVREDTETVRMNLRAGRVRVDVNPPSGAKADFTVVSPTATASVRGTGFEMGTRSVQVNEGVVAYRGSRGAPALVYAGSENSVNITTGKAANSVDIIQTGLLPPPPAGTDNAMPDVTFIAGTVPQIVPDFGLVGIGFGFDP